MIRLLFMERACCDALFEALEALEALDQRKADVIRLRAVWGMEMSEIAASLDVSLATVERDWRFAKNWLAEELEKQAMDEIDTFRRLEALFHKAMDLPQDRREAYLEEECGEDTTLLDEVRKLLEREHSRTALGVLGSAEHIVAKTADISGHHMGAYEIRRELGFGGMGAVYPASRADDEYRKDVAIKVVRDRLSNELVARFRNERQILATLEHPNIARLLDGGTTDDGFPYVVMEYVDGRPINDFCDQERLTIRQRLELFLKVCAAVRYSHQNLIVHRDTKPHNILVTDDGTPKVLDFGIEKLLTKDQAANPAALTVAVARRLTPDFASPEQVRGEPITTASDVYSLGVLLYELLSGHQPYRITTQSAIEIERVIAMSYRRRPAP